jgi:hypothetical protein
MVTDAVDRLATGVGLARGTLATTCTLGVSSPRIAAAMVSSPEPSAQL